MTTPTTTPVVREVTVPCGRARAFAVFTTHFDTWWPRGHHIGAAALDRAVIEPRVGGRWYEVGVDGSECDWGRVLAWDAPHRVVLTWQLNGRWEYDPDDARASEVEVTFTAVTDDETLVRLEHRYLERLVDGDAARGGVSGDGGWSGILRNFAAVAAVAPA